MTESRASRLFAEARELFDRSYGKEKVRARLREINASTNEFGRLTLPYSPFTDDEIDWIVNAASRETTKGRSYR